MEYKVYIRKDSLDYPIYYLRQDESVILLDTKYWVLLLEEPSELKDWVIDSYYEEVKHWIQVDKPFLPYLKELILLLLASWFNPEEKLADPIGLGIDWDSITTDDWEMYTLSYYLDALYKEVFNLTFREVVEKVELTPYRYRPIGDYLAEIPFILKDNHLKEDGEFFFRTHFLKLDNLHLAYRGITKEPLRLIRL